MALLVGELKSVLDLDTSKYDQGLDRSHDRFKKFVKGAAIASAAVSVAAGAGLLGLAKGAAEDEKAQSILAKTLKNTAKATDAQVASIEEYITKTGAATGVTDDEMRPALANLVRATHDVGKAQSLMGLAMDVSAGTGKDLGAVTMALAKAQNGSVGGLAKLGIATKDASGKTLTFDQIQKNLAKTFTGQSAAAAETTAGKFDRLKLIVSEAGESIGAKMLPVLLALGTFLLERVIPAVVTFGTRVEIKLLPVLRQVRDFFANQIIPQLKEFAGFVRDTVIPAVSDVVSTFTGLGRKLVTAIGPVDVLGIVGSITSGAKTWAAGLITGFKTGLEQGNWKPLGTAIGNGVVTALRGASTVVDRIGTALGALLDMVNWGALGGKISGAITGMLRSVDWGRVGDALGDALVSVVQTASTLGQKLGTAFKDVMNRIDWEAVGRDSTNAIGRFIAGVDWVQLGKVLGLAVLKSLKINKSVYDAVIASAADLLTGMFKVITAKIEEGRLWVVAKTKELGRYLWSGLKSGIVAGAKGIGGFIKSVIVDPIVNWAKSLFGIHSPSTVFAAIGIQLLAGLRAGIAAGARGIGVFLSRTVIAPVVGAFSRAGTWLVQHGRNFVAGFKSGVATIARGIGRWMYDRIISPAVAPFGRAGSWLVSAGRNVIAGFKNGMVQIWGSVVKWVGGIATWIKNNKGPVSLDGTLLIPAGRAIMSGFLKGLKSGAGPAWNFVQSVGGKTKDALFAALGGPFMGGGGPAPTNLSGMQALVRTVAAQRGWGSGAQWDALYKLVQGESGFNPNAQNPTSTAYGLFQFLNSTWASVGASKTSDPWAQTVAGLTYIARSYGSPVNAYSKWLSRSPHWYELGTPYVPRDGLAYLHEGERVITADQNTGKGDPMTVQLSEGDRKLLQRVEGAIERLAGRPVEAYLDGRRVDEGMSSRALAGGYR